MFDTWRMLRSGMYGQDDYVLAAVSIYLDLLNMFLLHPQSARRRAGAGNGAPLGVRPFTARSIRSASVRSDAVMPPASCVDSDMSDLRVANVDVGMVIHRVGDDRDAIHERDAVGERLEGERLHQHVAAPRPAGKSAEGALNLEV